jgi:hypothetical protein
MISDVLSELASTSFTVSSDAYQNFKLLKRREVKTRKRKFIAYDFETTRIKSGTPIPLYITAHGKDFRLSVNLKKPLKKDSKPELVYEYLCEILETYFLTDDNKKASFVAWNGNNYDAYFIAKALLTSDRWVLRPYLAGKTSLRGIKVIDKENKGHYWEFLDGISMTGMTGKTLKEFLKTFAPDYQKLDLNFDETEFDCNNPEHIKYAERDSEGLYYGIERASEIVHTLTGHDLQTTIGNLAIKYFESQIPDNVLIWRVPEEVFGILHGPVKRGGYCWTQRQYKGNVWKYDLNQAYAAAMRDTLLPCHACIQCFEYEKDRPGIYHVVISRSKLSQIPFYYYTLEKHYGAFTNGAEVETWLTSIEVEHLKRDNWTVKILKGYYWEQHFNMKEMVNKLELLRTTDKDGPSGPLGTMVKALGNNAYGKTLEKLDGLELQLAKECPDNFMPYDEFDKQLENVFFRFREVTMRNYHQPQIGVFVTAHVRILVREAALKSPDTFLYADTDCTVFSAPVMFLDTDAKRYGAWKIEEEGKPYIIIGKKIYCDMKDDSDKNKIKKSKGLNTKRLKTSDFESWYEGNIPKQQQLQRNNFVKFVSGQSMFKDQERAGSDVRESKQAKLVGMNFEPIAR